MNGLGIALEIQRSNKNTSKPSGDLTQNSVDALGKMAPEDAVALAKAIMAKFAPVPQPELTDDLEDDVSMLPEPSGLEDDPGATGEPDIGAILGRIRK